MPRKVPTSAEARTLTRLGRIEKLLVKLCGGHRVSKREARAALKDLLDIKAFKHTPPPAKVLDTLRAWIEAEEKAPRGRGPTMEEVAHHSRHSTPTVSRHRDTLLAHGCLTKLSDNPRAGGNYVTTKFARDGIKGWTQEMADAEAEQAARVAAVEEKRRKTRGTHWVRPYH